ncbi:Nucleoporin POM33 [Candida tropicalis]
MSDDKKAAAAAGSKFKIDFNQEKLLKTVQSLQFAWFVGNVLTLLGFFIYTLSYFKVLPDLGWIWYLVSLLGAIISFGILLVQFVQKHGFKVPLLIKDDNFHYFLLASFLIALRCYSWITLVPFVIFSTFHVLNYANTHLLPIAGLEHNPVSKHITAFINKNNLASIQIACGIELLILIWLFLRMITFRKRSLTPFLVFLIFLKKRSEVSPFTRKYFEHIGAQIGSVVSTINNPVATQVWGHVQTAFRTIDSFKLEEHNEESKSDTASIKSTPKSVHNQEHEEDVGSIKSSIQAAIEEEEAHDAASIHSAAPSVKSSAHSMRSSHSVKSAPKVVVKKDGRIKRIRRAIKDGIDEFN